MITQQTVHAISGPQAAELANITYRQLDYWARQGWVTPSVEAGTGRPGRRIYGADDVVKLAALGHFGRSGVDVGLLGPAVAGLKLPQEGDWLLVSAGDPAIEVVSAADLRRRVAAPGSCSVFDPAAVRARLAGAGPQAAPAARRTA